MDRKRKVSLLVVFALVTSLFSGCLTAFAEQHYTDVDESHWAAEWVNYMHEKGYIHGYPDGTYLPENNITRAEFVTILNYIHNNTTPAANQFTDNNEGDWYYNQINCAVYAGYLHGYGDGTVKPNNFITREEAAVVIAQAYQAKLTSTTDFSDMDQVSDWALDSVRLMKDAEMVPEGSDNRFRPKDNLLRAEVAAMIYGIEKGIEDGDIETNSVTLPNGVTAVEGKDGSFQFNDVIGTNGTNNQLQVVVTVVENTAGDFTITYTKDGVENTVTPEELQQVVFTENELQQANFVFNFADPKDGTSAKITVKVTDNGEDASQTKTYEFTFGSGASPSPTPTNRPGGGSPITGGGTSTPSPTPVPTLDPNEDRVAKALEQMRTNNFADINNGDQYLSDPVEIVIANDGMEIDDITSPQASKADQGKAVLDTLIDERLSPVYEDVAKYVVNESTALQDFPKFETANKKEFVVYFRAMVKVVDVAAQSAVDIYNDPKYTTADAKYNAFIVDTPNDVIEKIDEVLEDAAITDSGFKNEIKTQAVAYCLAMFTAGEDDKDSIKDQLAAAGGTLTIDLLATILADHLVMAD